MHQEIIWKTLCFCNRAVNYLKNKETCVNQNLLTNSVFYLGNNENYPVNRYCEYCGCNRFSDDELGYLLNPKTTYADIERHPTLNYIVTKSINPIICTSSDCLVGLYNVGSKIVNNYELEELLNEKGLGTDSTLVELFS